MAGNSIGQLFRVTTFGESHGRSLGCVVDGCPPGLALKARDLQKHLDRRKPGQSRFTTQRRESDEVAILSGVFEGVTTGTPIGLLIENQDQRSRDYAKIKDRFRPGHADFTYFHKYGLRDYKGGGRSSARETTMRVAAGAIARKYLEDRFNISITGYLHQMGDIEVTSVDLAEIDGNAFFCPQADLVPALEKRLNQIRKEGDSIGAGVTVICSGVPVGLGEPVFGRLDADLAHALMSINAVKGVEIGAGFGSIRQRGSEHRDEITPDGFVGNNAGGVLGGISTGQDLVARLALKPTSSIQVPGQTVDVHGEPVPIVTTGRHDPCVGIRAVPIAEAMMAIVVMDHLLRHRAQNGEVHPDLSGGP